LKAKTVEGFFLHGVVRVHAKKSLQKLEIRWCHIWYFSFLKKTRDETTTKTTKKKNPPPIQQKKLSNAGVNVDPPKTRNWKDVQKKKGIERYSRHRRGIHFSGCSALLRLRRKHLFCFCRSTTNEMGGKWKKAQKT
jgi:hypothetical protein